MRCRRSLQPRHRRAPLHWGHCTSASPSDCTWGAWYKRPPPKASRQRKKRGDLRAPRLCPLPKKTLAEFQRIGGGLPPPVQPIKTNHHNQNMRKGYCCGQKDNLTNLLSRNRHQMKGKIHLFKCGMPFITAGDKNATKTNVYSEHLQRNRNAEIHQPKNIEMRKNKKLK